MAHIIILAITVFTIILMAGLAIFVGFGRVHLRIKAAFIVFCIFISLWMLSNALADMMDVNGALIMTRLAFASIALAALTMLAFAYVFPRPPAKHLINHWHVWLSVGWAILVASLCFTNAIIPAVHFDSGSATVNYGEWYGPYVIYCLTIGGWALVTLLRKYTQYQGIERERVKFVFLGLVVATMIVSTTNLILPLLMGVNPWASYGSFAIIFFVIAMAFSVVRHHLFDINAVTARASAYLFTGLTTGLILTVVIIVADSLLFQQRSSFPQRVLYVMLSVLIGYLFPVFKHFFDRITKRLFLRDSYESAHVLAAVASAISRSPESRVFIRETLYILQKQLNLTSAAYYVIKDSKIEKLYGKASKANDVSEIMHVLGIVPREADVVDVYDIEHGYEGQYEAFLLLRLDNEIIGVVALGSKKSGIGYSRSDKEMLAAVTHELAVASENYQRFEEIRSFNATLQTNIKDATSELRVSNAKLREIDASKDEFISMASHQLRTPLTSIKGYISMLLEGDLGELQPAQRQALEQAYGSSQRMVYLIGDFLNLSRIQTGKFELEMSSVSLPKLIAEEIGQLRESAKTRNVELLYSPPENFPEIKADETKLRQVMMNFIDNAIYYAKPTGGEILIMLEQRRDDVVFVVKDNGIGVPVHERKRLFTKFYRAGNAKKARPGGTGIGLFMAKRVIVAHGGRIIFSSKENEGSEFGFSLPLTKT